MDTIKDSLADMMEMFQRRMAEFDAELQKSPTASSTSSTLAVEFASFRAFITKALGNLQNQVQILAHNLDNLEMRGRRKMLLLHGVKEEKSEDTALVVSNLFKDRLSLHDFTPLHIKRCLRMGRSSDTSKPRPILCKLHDVAIRDRLWYAKTKLKGSGITMSEFLTKMRHDVFVAARQKFGVAKCWTQEGNVFVIGAGGARVRVTTLQDVNNIEPVDTPKTVTPPTRPTKSRRAAANKNIKN